MCWVSPLDGLFIAMAKLKEAETSLHKFQNSKNIKNLKLFTIIYFCWEVSFD